MGVRRLEHRREEKYWEAWIKDDLIFCYRYGKLGSPGHTKLKKFKTNAEASAELEEKLREKLGEGFSEVREGAPAAPAPGTPAAPSPARPPAPDAGEAAAKAGANIEIPPLQARYAPRTPTDGEIDAARQALARLAEHAGTRSWRVARAARKARTALARLGGMDPSTHPALGAAFDAVMDLIIAPQKRLPLEQAMGLLWELDAAVFARIVTGWQRKVLTSPSADALGVLAALLEQVGPEIAIHAGAALLERHLPADAWRRRFQKVKPSLAASLGKNGISLGVFLDALHAERDPILRERLTHAREAA